MSNTHESDTDSIESLQQLRDEIRLQMHLAGMGAKERFAELEAQFEDLTRTVAKKTDTAVHIVDDARETARGALDDLRTRYELFRESIKDRTGH